MNYFISKQTGVYEVPNDSRIQDVLITAGGMTAKANRKYVSENINLSQKIYDGQKIYIPEINSSNSSNLSNLTNLSNLISLNQATEQELDTLPGIGLITARKIITGRPYQNISELVEKHLINQTTFNKIKDKISL
ncbi:helix-hairpin-helix domain-containing protein [Candidatus Gottesmanbacteria bacterium]|nr:helix-hairpin-helix domain-containing protein [Candidatus Gottesmanbacteria bacterium]